MSKSLASYFMWEPWPSILEHVHRISYDSFYLPTISPPVPVCWYSFPFCQLNFLVNQLYQHAAKSMVEGCVYGYVVYQSVSAWISLCHRNFFSISFIWRICWGSVCLKFCGLKITVFQNLIENLFLIVACSNSHLVYWSTVIASVYPKYYNMGRQTDKQTHKQTGNR
jgi:hypothetical protein